MRRAFMLSIVFLLLAGSGGQAQSTGRDLKKEAAIWAQLQAVAPEAVDVFKEATTKMDAGDYKGAAELYRKVVDARPRFDPALRRLGSCRAESGELAEGLKSLELAVELNRSPENLAGLAQTLALSDRNPPKDRLERALALANEAVKAAPEPDVDYLALTAQIALNLQNDSAFREAAARLVREFPNTMFAHYFNGVRAIMDEDWTESEDEIRRAEALGLPHNIAEGLLASGVHSRAAAWRFAYYSLALLGVWVLGLALLFFGGKALSIHTLKSIERYPGSADSAATANERTLRKAYGWLVGAASVYYYVSLPVVIFLLVAVAGSIAYGFLMIGTIPIKLMLFLLIATLVTIFKMIHSLFIKLEQKDPGRALKREEAPGLWALTEDVAMAVGTRPIEEIRITPGTDLGVYENGTRREKARDKAKRVLILGAGVLNDFQTAPFRAVLAHEYGHFAHRDTAGGAAALRVRNDMMKFAYAMANAGQAQWWNIGFQFVRLYHFLFIRISHGASRLQEVLADRMAVAQYGAEAFEAGLTHAIRRGVEFPKLATAEIQSAVQAGRPLHNVYNLTPHGQSTPIEQEVEKELNQPTSENDTHPSPADRFRLVRHIKCKNNTARDESLVWDLFVNKDALTTELNALIDHSLERPAAVSPPVAR